MKNCIAACLALGALTACVGTAPQHTSTLVPELAVPMAESGTLTARTWSADGAVKAPGLYRFDGPLTLREAISAAGGLTGDADRRNIQLTHSDKSWQDFTYRQTQTSQVTVQAGDRLSVQVLSRMGHSQTEPAQSLPFDSPELPMPAWLGWP